jgi:hypothetical protein
MRQDVMSKWLSRNELLCLLSTLLISVAAPSANARPIFPGQFDFLGISGLGINASYRFGTGEGQAPEPTMFTGYGAIFEIPMGTFPVGDYTLELTEPAGREPGEGQAALEPVISDIFTLTIAQPQNAPEKLTFKFTSDAETGLTPVQNAGMDAEDGRLQTFTQRALKNTKGESLPKLEKGQKLLIQIQSDAPTPGPEPESFMLLLMGGLLLIALGARSWGKRGGIGDR